MKLRNLFFCMLAIMAFVACKDDLHEVDPILEVSPSKVSLGAVAPEKVFYLLTNNNWTIETSEEWLSVSPSSGEPAEEDIMIRIYAEDNPLEEERTATITIKSGQLTAEVTVTQEAAEPAPTPALTVSVEALAFGLDELEKTFTITANNDWAVAADVEWLSFDPSTGVASEEATEVKVTAQENTLREARTAKITVTSAELTKEITVTQVAGGVQGEGTESDPYLLQLPEDVVNMRNLAPENGETWFKMANDIDMSGVDNYVPVNFDNEFTRKVHFDGANFTLSNFSCNAEVHKGNYPSIFGVLYGLCKNLKLDKPVITAKGTCGVIGGYVGTTEKPGVVENVTITGAVVNTDAERAGGVCGNAKYATFTNVSFQGTITSTLAESEAKSGGFVGQSEEEATFTGCDVDVVITGASTDLGGFAGKVVGTATFTDCDVKVVLESTAATKNRCGGFIGWNSSEKTTITNCHVLEGSTLTDKSERATTSNGNYGGFIGFGDTAGTVLEIKNSSSAADVNAGNSYYNCAFVAGLGYASTATIENCTVTGDVTASGNYSAGIMSNVNNANAVVTITDCSYDGAVKGAGYTAGIVGGTKGKCTITGTSSSGSVTGTSDYVGGIMGAAQHNEVTISKSWSSSSVSAKGQKVGGIVGTTTNAISIANCYSTGDISADGQQVAGVLGYSNKATTITNCFVTGDIKSNTAASAGILATLQSTTSSVTGCIVWSEKISCMRVANNKWAPGAIIGAAQPNGTYKACWRNPAMTLSDGFMTLVDHEDIENGTPPLPSYTTTDNTQRAYHGKAAAADATISSVAKTIGWDTTIWDLSGDTPKLK